MSPIEEQLIDVLEAINGQLGRIAEALESGTAWPIAVEGLVQVAADITGDVITE